jgi:antitoxin component of MazEF toxin-antitoxin module
MVKEYKNFGVLYLKKYKVRKMGSSTHIYLHEALKFAGLHPGDEVIVYIPEFGKVVIEKVVRNEDENQI